MTTKKVKNEQFLQIWFYTDMKSTKKAILQQKKPRNHFIQGQFTFGIQLQTLPSKCNNINFQSKNWNTAEENSFRTRRQLYWWVQWCERKGLTNFFELYLNLIWAPVQWHVCISRSSRFFLVFAGQKHISQFRHAHGHRRAGASRRSIKIIQHTYCSIRSRISKDTVNKAEKTNSLVPRSKQKVSKEKGWETQKDSK